jgi:hypothetical protein
MSNDVIADLDSKLKASGHDVWGWIIYRCTYNSHYDWSAFIKALDATTEYDLEFYGSTEAIAKQHIWTVIDDRERLEHASKTDVRRMFNDWVRSPEAAAEQPNAKVPVCEVPMARYRYCVQVDEASLRSVLDDSRDWHVNIINRDWVPKEEESEYGDSEDDEVPEEAREAETWPEIGGCTEEDVGWVKASRGILVEDYVSLCNPNFWYAYHTRPPQRAR